MLEKNINSRVTHKHDVEANWVKAINFIPKAGEIVIYDVDDKYNYSRFRTGNGIDKINDLPFSNTPVFDINNDGILFIC